MDIQGDNKVRQVLFSGRPPTKNAKSQGSHIVALALFEAAIRGQLEGKYLKPNPESLDEDAIEGLRRILKSFTISEAEEKTKIEDKLERLKFRRDTTIVMNSSSGNVDDFKKEVRQKLSTIRQGLNIVTEDIIRLWNRRIYAVYPTEELEFASSKGTVKIQAAQVYGSEMTSRENSSLNLFRQFEKLDLPQIQDLTLSDPAEKTAVGKIAEATNEEVFEQLSRLIDIKSKKEFKSKKLYFEGEALDSKDYEGEHEKYYDFAVEEAVKLAILAFPASKSILARAKPNQAFDKSMVNAMIEDMDKKIKNGKNEEVLQNYTQRLTLLQENEKDDVVMEGQSS